MFTKENLPEAVTISGHELLAISKGTLLKGEVYKTKDIPTGEHVDIIQWLNDGLLEPYPKYLSDAKPKELPDPVFMDKPQKKYEISEDEILIPRLVGKGHKFLSEVEEKCKGILKDHAVELIERIWIKEKSLENPNQRYLERIKRIKEMIDIRK